MIQNFQSQQERWGFKPSLSSHTCFNNFFYRLVFCGYLFPLFSGVLIFSSSLGLVGMLTYFRSCLVILGVSSSMLFFGCFFTFSCNFLIFESIELSLFTESKLLANIFVSDISSCFRVFSYVSKSETQSHKTMASFSCFSMVLPPSSSSSLSSVNLESSS